MVDFELPTQWEYIVLYIASSSIASGVVVNFLTKLAQPESPIREEKIAVATLTMTTFFLIIFLIGVYGIGTLAVSEEVQFVSKLTGCGLVIIATIVNLAGRVALGRFWSDQIEIQKEHQIVRHWPYNWSRHPLYGSLVIFGVGMGLLMTNLIMVTATLITFLPAMRYRARREEDHLIDLFGAEYRQYQQETPMMLPYFPEPISRAARAGLAMMQVWAATLGLLDVFLLSAVLTLGLSFVMQREDFRIAYKIKPGVIILCVAIAAIHPPLAALLWVPTFASLMSLTGQCPGTLLLRAVKRHRSKGLV